MSRLMLPAIFRFSLCLPLLLGFFYLLKSPQAEVFVDVVCHTLALSTFSVVHLFNADIILNRYSIYLGTAEYGINVVPSCSALPMYLTVVSLILVEKVSVGNKLKAIVIGFVVVEALNLLRLCLLFYARVYASPPTFNVIHDIYFPASLFILVVFCYWRWISKTHSSIYLLGRHHLEQNEVNSNNNVINGAKCASVAVVLFIVCSVFLQPYFKHLLYLPTSLFVQVSNVNWQSETRLNQTTDTLVISNSIFSSRTAIAEAGEQRKVNVNQRTGLTVSPSTNMLLLPLLLGIFLVNKRRSFHELAFVLLSPFIVEAISLALLYHYQIINVLNTIAFPGVVISQGVIAKANIYSLEWGEFLKHTRSTILYFTTLLIPVFYWRYLVLARAEREGE
ncbi:hypothetical protein J3L16_08155 [Alteromonas sp. 5E99-2]|uniref:hypothetical protein n=1 Tax=Alteromonas sp. 5E99-2 TaxID=2817683 RepID=UPI001A99DD38|nr:hypothetical protein [Alteromonas sp. 5E99-2]MBO1255653.1 hypothetical protein [Alteromonas sp. 5E99-2]